MKDMKEQHTFTENPPVFNSTDEYTCEVYHLIFELLDPEYGGEISCNIATKVEKYFNELILKDNICGFCNQPGANYLPLEAWWPGEKSAGTELAHKKCADAERERAHDNLTVAEREEFLANFIPF